MLAQQFVEQLLSNFPNLAFQIVATVDSVTWQIVELRNADENTFRRAILATYPDAQVIVNNTMNAGLRDVKPFYRDVLKYIATKPFLGPLKHVTDIRANDPLAAITRAMTGLREGEQITYSLHVATVAPDHVYREGYEQVTVPGSGGRRPRYTREVQRVVEAKRAARLYLCTLFIEVNSPDRTRVEDFPVALDNQIVLFKREGFNELAQSIYSGPLRILNAEQDAQTTALAMSEQFFTYHPENLFEAIGGLFRKKSEPLRSPRWFDSLSAHEQAKMYPLMRLVLDPAEIGALWHLPNAEFSVPAIAWAPKQQVHIPTGVANNKDGLRLGMGLYRDQRVPALLSSQVRTSHVSIVGKTRTGKSSLMHHLIHQDIAAGRGVAVIDAHGDLVRNILRASIPLGRENDVVVVDIADMQNPPALNLLATTSMDKSLTTAGDVADVMAMIYGDMHDVPRARETLACALATVWQDDTPTPLDVPRIFENAEYRLRLTQTLGVENIRLLQFWRYYESQNKNNQVEISAPVTYRMQALVGNQALLPILCHPSNLNFGKLMDENKIILVSLAVDSTIIPEKDQDLLGAIIVSALQRSAQIRPTNNLFALYIDEAQRFVTTSLARLFSEAGKRGITVTLANQFYKQLAGETLDAVMGNVGSIIAFRSGMEDARLLSPYLKPAFDVDDLVQLENYNAEVWMQQAAFSLKTDPPFQADNEASVSREAALRARSRERYTPMTREAILKWIQTRYIDGDDQSNQPDDPRYDPDADGKS